MYLWLVLCSCVLASVTRDPRFTVDIFQNDIQKGQIYYDPFTNKKSKMSELDVASNLEAGFLVAKYKDSNVMNASISSTKNYYRLFLDENCLFTLIPVQVFHMDSVPSTENKVTLHFSNFPNRPYLNQMPDLDAQGQIPAEDNRSFIQKYWLVLVNIRMYIVPTLIILLFSGGEEPKK